MVRAGGRPRNRVHQRPTRTSWRRFFADVGTRAGKVAEGTRILEEARVRFSSAGLVHDALACAIHRAYWQERSRRGSSARSARAALGQIVGAGGEGFKWYDARVARWSVPLVGTRHPAAAERIDRRAAAVFARGSPERERRVLAARIAFYLGGSYVTRAELAPADAVLAWAEGLLGRAAAGSADLLHLGRGSPRRAASATHRSRCIGARSSGPPPHSHR